MRILAFSGSNSSLSLNQKLIRYSAGLVKFPVDIIDLRNYELPMVSVDEEQRNGYPKKLIALHKTFIAYDAYMIALPEHNGNYPAFFKNIVDWLSRIERGFFRHKPVLLMNAAPGSHGGKSVLEIATTSFPFFDGRVVETFLLPDSGALKKEGKEPLQAKDELRHALSRFEHCISPIQDKKFVKGISLVKT